MQQERRRGKAWWPFALLLVLCFSPPSRAETSGQDLAEAQRLAWNQQFPEAERLYRQLLLENPNSRDVSFGLAQVVLWRRRYREARKRFLDLVRRDPSDVEA